MSADMAANIPASQRVFLIVELREMIFHHLDVRSVICAEQVNKIWQGTCRAKCPHIARLTRWMLPVKIQNDEDVHFFKSEALGPRTRSEMEVQNWVTCCHSDQWSPIRTPTSIFTMCTGFESCPHENLYDRRFKFVNLHPFFSWLENLGVVVVGHKNSIQMFLPPSINGALRGSRIWNGSHIGGSTLTITFSETPDRRTSRHVRPAPEFKFSMAMRSFIKRGMPGACLWAISTISSGRNLLTLPNDFHRRVISTHIAEAYSRTQWSFTRRSRLALSPSAWKMQQTASISSYASFSESKISAPSKLPTSHCTTPRDFRCLFESILHFAYTTAGSAFTAISPRPGRL
ncbi:hypothetical protein EJ04DRAFT_525770 [Polyplosphaeria fusca]|uniref:F-box domain-containing protein n=1 Tax=Polyplosphaeria fusca TaxID=682080 RepID=A0A9P4QVW2_9PLEO|nr:hypothetical protein EJ04DRAFT_525770 [Polyplosphaeria fusca]